MKKYRLNRRDLLRTTGASLPGMAGITQTTVAQETGEPEFEITAQSTTEAVAPGETIQLLPAISNTGDSTGDPSAYFQAATESTPHNADYYGDEFDVVAHNDDGGEWAYEGWGWNDVEPGETREPSIELTVAETVEPGEYTFRVEVRSGGSSDDTATVTITVEESGEPGGDVSLTLAITDATAEAGGTATVAYLLTNEGNTESTGLQGVIDLPPGNWQLGESGSFTSLGPGESDLVSAEVLVPEGASGEYTINGSVTDDAGNKASASATITVEEAGEPEFELTASGDETPPGGEATVSLELSNIGTATAGTVGIQLWGQAHDWNVATTQTDGGMWYEHDRYWDIDDLASGASRSPSITFEIPDTMSPGEYVVDAEAVLPSSDYEVLAEATATVTISEDNTPPNAAFTITPEGPTVGDTLTLDASESNDPDGTIETYEWKVGDGDTFTPEGPELTTEISKAGEMTVSLRVTDDVGATDTTSREVEIGGSTAPLAGRDVKLARAEVIESHSVLSPVADELGSDISGDPELAEQTINTLEQAVEEGSLDRETAEAAIQRMTAAETATGDILQHLGPSNNTNTNLARATARVLVSVGFDLALIIVAIKASAAAGAGAVVTSIAKVVSTLAEDALTYLMSEMLPSGNQMNITSTVDSLLHEEATSIIDQISGGALTGADAIASAVEAIVDTLVDTIAGFFRAFAELGNYQLLAAPGLVGDADPSLSQLVFGNSIYGSLVELSVAMDAESLSDGIAGDTDTATASVANTATNVTEAIEGTVDTIEASESFSSEFNIFESIEDILSGEKSNALEALQALAGALAGGVLSILSKGTTGLAGAMSFIVVQNANAQMVEATIEGEEVSFTHV